MNEMKPEDVMRALECFANGKRCEGEQCAYFKLRVGFCGSDLAKDALDLIHRLQILNTKLLFGVAKTRAEAITEFEDRLKTFYRHLNGKTVGGSVEYHIEQIAKEMRGE